MNTIALIIGNTIITTAAILASAYLAYHDKAGWGWLIVCALFCGVGIERVAK